MKNKIWILGLLILTGCVNGLVVDMDVEIIDNESISVSNDYLNNYYVNCPSGNCSFSFSVPVDNTCNLSLIFDEILTAQLNEHFKNLNASFSVVNCSIDNDEFQCFTIEELGNELDDIFGAREDRIKDTIEGYIPSHLQNVTDQIYRIREELDHQMEFLESKVVVSAAEREEFRDQISNLETSNEVNENKVEMLEERIKDKEHLHEYTLWMFGIVLFLVLIVSGAFEKMYFKVKQKGGR